MHEYIVKSTHRITDTTLLLDLEPKSGVVSFTYRPGQYAGVSFYDNNQPTQVRCFSIINSPADKEMLQFSMRIKGDYTKAAANLVPGSIVNISGPYGGFILDMSTGNELVFLAAGIGIAPFMSMLSYVSTTKSSVKITMLYSCGTQDDVPFLDRLRGFLNQNSNLKILFVISRGPIDRLNGLSVFKGRLTSDVIDLAMNYKYNNRTFFVCGPTSYMDVAQAALNMKGVHQKDIITEAFD